MEHIVANNEVGQNYIPQYSDFKIKFSGITKDGEPLNFSEVTRWHFSIGQTLSSSPILALNSSTNSGSFVVNSGSSYVTVTVGATGIANGYGQFYTALYAQQGSGYITHLIKYISVMPGLPRT